MFPPLRRLSGAVSFLCGDERLRRIDYAETKEELPKGGFSFFASAQFEQRCFCKKRKPQQMLRPP